MMGLEPKPCPLKRERVDLSELLRPHVNQHGELHLEAGLTDMLFSLLKLETESRLLDKTFIAELLEQIDRITLP